VRLTSEEDAPPSAFTRPGLSMLPLEGLLAPEYVFTGEVDGDRELRTGGSYAEARRTKLASRSRLASTELDGGAGGGSAAQLPLASEERAGAGAGAEAEADELFLQVKGRPTRGSAGGSVSGRSAAPPRRGTEALAGASVPAAVVASGGMAAVPLPRVSAGRAAAWPGSTGARSSARSTTADELDYATFFPINNTRRSTAHEIAEQAVDQLLSGTGVNIRGGQAPSRRSAPGTQRRPSQPGAPGQLRSQAQGQGQGQGQGQLQLKGPSVSIELAEEAAVPVSTHAGRPSSRGASRRSTMNT
jgi:hypothetical protein